MWALWVAVVIAVVVSLVVLINCIINNKVKQNSRYYNNVLKLNRETTFFVIDTQLLNKTFYLNSKRAFDTFNVSKHASDYINNNRVAFDELIARIEKNRETQKAYNEKYSRLEHTADPKVAKKTGVRLETFVKRESKLANSIKKSGCVDLQLVIHYQYTSPAGRNHYSASQTFSYNEIRRMRHSVSVTLSFSPNSSKSHLEKSNKAMDDAFSACFNDLKPTSVKPLTIDDIENIDE